MLDPVNIIWSLFIAIQVLLDKYLIIISCHETILNFEVFLGDVKLFWHSGGVQVISGAGTHWDLQKSTMNEPIGFCVQNLSLLLWLRPWSLLLGQKLIGMDVINFCSICVIILGQQTDISQLNFLVILTFSPTRVEHVCVSNLQPRLWITYFFLQNLSSDYLISAQVSFWILRA